MNEEFNYLRECGHIRVTESIHMDKYSTNEELERVVLCFKKSRYSHKVQGIVLNSNDMDTSCLRHLKGFDNTTHLSIRVSGTDIDLSFLKHWEKLRFLSIYCMEHETISTNYLPTDVRRVVINATRITELDLSQFPCIELDLRNNMLEKMDLFQIERIDRIWRLSLDNNCLTELDLKPLEKAKNLSILSFKNNSIRAVDITPLIYCEGLKKFNSGQTLLYVKGQSEAEEQELKQRLPTLFNEFLDRVHVGFINF